MSSLLKLRRVVFIAQKKCHSSALYIIGDKARETFAVLIPKIDFEQRIKDRNVLAENIRLRGLDTNLDEIQRVWNFYKHVKVDRDKLEMTRSQIGGQIKNLSQDPRKHAQEIEKLKNHGRLLKEDLKTVKESLIPLQEKAAIKVLSLPNVLHRKTPTEESTIIHTFREKPQNAPESHLKIAQEAGLLEFHDSSYFFMKGEAALLDLKLPHYFQSFLDKKGCILFSNPDFARSVVVEGCGVDFHDSKAVFTLEEPTDEHFHANSRLHLVGGASLQAFMVFCTKLMVQKSLFPLKYFTISKKYQPSCGSDLFSSWQGTCVELFSATLDSDKAMDEQFNQMLTNLVHIYESFGSHFQVKLVAAKDLLQWESLRASLQMYSPHKQDYVEVANLSISDNYISKRLLFNYTESDKQICYPRIISGTALCVPKFLGCLLEGGEKHGESFIPKVIKNMS